MIIKIDNGRQIGLDYSSDDLNSFAREAFESGLLQPGMQLFRGYGRAFVCIRDGVVTTHCMRSNWNGWNDCNAFSTSDWTEIGEIEPAEGSAGRHRNVLRLN